VTWIGWGEGSLKGSIFFLFDLRWVGSTFGRVL
jgi:hypothetical protein